MSQRLPAEVFVPPLPSFPVPVAPPEPTEEQTALCIPATWEPVVRGALQQLIQPATWQGTEEEIKAAQDEAATIIATMTEGCGTSGIPTPFWDDVTDTDDEYPAELQPWYGYVTDPEAPADELTFVEDATIWVLTGMLAVGASPAAAVLFQTIAPRFALAMRGGDVVEVIRIILDGEEQATVTTSGDPDELITVPVVGDPDISLHDLLIVLREIT